jgi:hypothetical protein
MKIIKPVSYSLEMTPAPCIKHIDVKYHFTRFQINEGVITLIDIRTEDQLVDLFTKQQTVKRHTKDCKQWFGS